MESRERALLGGVEIFGELDERALDEVLRAAHRRRVAQGDTVFRQGEEAQSFYVLVEGRLKVTQVTPEGQQVVVRSMGPGEVFGCVAVFGGRRYPGTATAVEDTRILGWTKGATQRLMERHPRLAINTLGTVGGRLQESQGACASSRPSGSSGASRAPCSGSPSRPESRSAAASGSIPDFAPGRRRDDGDHAAHREPHPVRLGGAGFVESGRQKITICLPDALTAIAEDGSAPER